MCLLLLTVLWVAVRPQMYHYESRVLYELILVAFDWFQILIKDHLLILILTLCLHYMHDSIESTASYK